MLRVHYYRYDQDYTGWELWIWEKGREGSLYMFNFQEYLMVIRKSVQNSGDRCFRF